jgi:hypothetical protein
MTNAASEAHSKHARLSRVGTIEGYLAFLILVSFFAATPFVQRIPEPYGQAIAITLWALAWIFSLSGVRHGKGAGRVAAGFTLGLLSLHALTLLVIAYH